MNTFDGLFFLLARTWLAMKGNTKQERGTAEVHPCASTFKSVSVSYSTWSGDGRDTLRNNNYVKVSSGEVSTIKCTPWLVRLKPSTQVMRIRMPLPPPHPSQPKLGFSSFDCWRKLGGVNRTVISQQCGHRFLASVRRMRADWTLPCLSKSSDYITNVQE